MGLRGREEVAGKVPLFWASWGGGSGFPSMLWSIGVFLEWAGLRRGDDCCTELRHTTPSTRVPGWTADTEGGGFVVLYLKPVQFGLSVILA